jgi:hypothetical protein
MVELPVTEYGHPLARTFAFARLMHSELPMGR